MSLKRSYPYRNERCEFAALLNSVSVHAYSMLVDQHINNFACGKCFEIPEHVCFVSDKCEHCFCKRCAKETPFFEHCPLCKVTISEKDLVVDPNYWVYYECYKKKVQHIYSSTSGRQLTVEYLKTVKKPHRYNYLLQEECRKLFNKNANSPTKYAGGDIENVRLLLNFGANPNVLNKDGWTLMHEAVDYGHADVLQVLLQGGGLVNAYSLDRVTTCLHDALDDDHVNTSVISHLLVYGADIQARDRTGLTAVRKAELKHIDLVSLASLGLRENISLKYKPEEPPVLYGCHLPPSKQKLLNDFCQKFKLNKSSRTKVSKEVTHIIVEYDSCQPTFPVLFGILQGCYIVTMKWVQESLKADAVLLPELYEITGTKHFPRTGVPKQARLNSALLQPKLFAGGQFNILDRIEHMISLEEKEEVLDLITAGGGKILTRMNSCGESIGESFFYHAHGGPLHFCTVIVLHKTEPCKRGWETIGHFSLKWLHKTIQTFKIVP